MNSPALMPRVTLCRRSEAVSGKLHIPDVCLGFGVSGADAAVPDDSFQTFALRTKAVCGSYAHGFYI